MATLLLLIIYTTFISLGLPDSLLGVTWPAMQPDFGVPVSFAGFVSMLISGGTIVSSLFSGRLLRRFGTGRVTAFSVLLTAVALLGFSLAPAFGWLLFLALPLGLGGGAVDSALNAYIAEHYESRHMSWLHCFWGIGAMTGPIIISRVIANHDSWRKGYLTVSIIQFVLVTLLFLSLPLWTRKKARITGGMAESKEPEERSETGHGNPLEPLNIRGVKIVLVSFLFYCGIESTVGLWGSSFLVKAKGLDVATTAVWISFFYASITAGRLVSGFLTMRVDNSRLIRAGELIILIGTVLLLLPLPSLAAMFGVILVGLGCAPIFPCMLHETPVRFGAGNAQTIMGLQMAVAYTGATFLPPLFGFLASVSTLALLPWFILCYIAAMLASSEKLNSVLKRKGPAGNGVGVSG
jgi:fucose permease